MAKCTFCEGKGQFKCTTCGGTGTVTGYELSTISYIGYALPKTRECPYCNGTGWIKCKNCNGTGETS